MHLYRESNSLCIQLGPGQPHFKPFEVMVWLEGWRPRLKFYDWRSM